MNCRQLVARLEPRTFRPFPAPGLHCAIAQAEGSGLAPTSNNPRGPKPGESSLPPYTYAASVDLSTVIFLNSLFAIAAMVVSVTGFGFAMVATPIAILVMSPAQAVPVVVLSWLPLSILLAVNCFREINTGRVLRLYAGAMIGVPLGVYSLATLDPGTMRTATGLVAVAGVGMMARHAGNPFQRNALATCGAGFLSGLMGGVSGMTGPPVVLLGLKQRWPHAALRADLIGYFLILHFSIALLFRTSGLLDMETIAMSACSFPGIAVGFLAGLRLRGVVSERSYRSAALTLIGVAGILAVLLG